MTDTPKFSLDIERLSHITVLKLHGRLDGTTVVTLDHAIADLLNARKKTLVLDCEQLTYISRPGCGRSCWRHARSNRPAAARCFVPSRTPSPPCSRSAASRISWSSPRPAPTPSGSSN